MRPEKCLVTEPWSNEGPGKKGIPFKFLVSVWPQVRLPSWRTMCQGTATRVLVRTSSRTNLSRLDNVCRRTQDKFFFLRSSCLNSGRRGAGRTRVRHHICLNFPRGYPTMNSHDDGQEPLLFRLFPVTSIDKRVNITFYTCESTHP